MCWSSKTDSGCEVTHTRRSPRGELLAQISPRDAHPFAARASSTSRAGSSARGPRSSFRSADATSLPYGEGEFDVGVSTQVYEYVPDVTRALRELLRVVRPGGRILIVNTDWESLVWRSSGDERMKRVLAAWDEHAAHPDLPRRLAPMLRAVGFSVERVFVIPVPNVGTEANTYSGGLIELITAFTHGRQGLSEDDLESWSDALRALPSRGEYFFSLNRYMFLATKP